MPVLSVAPTGKERGENRLDALHKKGEEDMYGRQSMLT